MFPGDMASRATVDLNFSAGGNEKQSEAVATEMKPRVRVKPWCPRAQKSALMSGYV